MKTINQEIREILKVNKIIAKIKIDVWGITINCKTHEMFINASKLFPKYKVTYGFYNN